MRNLGFEYFATYKNAGYKLGKWKNVWVGGNCQLNEYSMEPKPPVKFSEIKMKEIGNILEISVSRY